MSSHDHLVAFIGMAVALVAILTVGTLLAADIIHLGSREPERTADGTERLSRGVASHERESDQERAPAR